MQLESVELPRDAFFGRVEAVPTDGAAGRIAAEQITPYPPGIPPSCRVSGSMTLCWIIFAPARAPA